MVHLAAILIVIVLLPVALSIAVELLPVLFWTGFAIGALLLFAVAAYNAPVTLLLIPGGVIVWALARCVDRYRDTPVLPQQHQRSNDNLSAALVVIVIMLLPVASVIYLWHEAAQYQQTVAERTKHAATQAWTTKTQQ